MEQLDLILSLVAGLVGFPAALAAVINLAKFFGLPDGLAGKVNFIVHLVVYLVVGVLVYLGKIDLLPMLDVQLSEVANVLIAVLAFLTSVGLAPRAHLFLRGVPLVGFSHSG